MNPDVGEVREYGDMMNPPDACLRIVYVVLTVSDGVALVLFLHVENPVASVRAGEVRWYRYDEPLFVYSDLVALGTPC